MPLAPWVRPGQVLNEDECQQLRHAAERRDQWIENYQRMELAKRGQVADHAAYIRELLSRVRAPLTGYVMQEGFSEGLHADGWRGAPLKTHDARCKIVASLITWGESR